MHLLTILYNETSGIYPTFGIILCLFAICIGLVAYNIFLRKQFNRKLINLETSYGNKLNRIREEVKAYQTDTQRIHKIIEDIHSVPDPAIEKPASLDEKLLRDAIGYVRDNIESPDMSVEDMSRKLGLSRTHLHRKLKALTGQSPVEFIRVIRMKQAASWLEQGNLSVSEVGYKVGYNSPSYFSSSFTSFFGVPPSTYVENSVKNKQQEVSTC